MNLHQTPLSAKKRRRDGLNFDKICITTHLIVIKIMVVLLRFRQGLSNMQSLSKMLY